MSIFFRTGEISTFLHVCFLVPRRYHDKIGQYPGDDDKAFFSISFHDWSLESEPNDLACVTNRENDPICTKRLEDNVVVNWHWLYDWVFTDLCYRTLCGDIPVFVFNLLC